MIEYSQTEVQQAAPKASIMIVDDNPNNLRLLAEFLGQEFKVRLFTSGAQALESAFSLPPDLILLDIMMPEVSGYELTAKLKKDDRTCEVPIIFISALDDINSKIQAFSAGGVDFITKPFRELEVLARIRTHLALRNLHRQLRNANVRLALQLEELQARNQELDAFAHTVAHDLKNPLSIIILAAHLLEDGYTSMPHEDIQRDLRAIAGTGEKMNRSLEGLILLAGLRKQSVEPRPLDMRSIVSEALQSLALLKQQFHAEIIVPANWPSALGYAPWLEEVWVNYISNAIKYGGNPEKGISPLIELGFDEAVISPAGHIRFWVHDNGSGLSLEQQQQLFTPFERLHNLRAKGHGLGLSIVRRIIEKLGGQVGLESAPGQGSLFYFTLPHS
ncbi:MAG: hybrid sensor histidine kinase/response regulator [Chloroflexota bacterium]